MNVFNLRSAMGRCPYGVNINPMAVERCNFALWPEASESGPVGWHRPRQYRCNFSGPRFAATTPSNSATEPENVVASLAGIKTVTRGEPTMRTLGFKK